MNKRTCVIDMNIITFCIYAEMGLKLQTFEANIV